MSRGSSGPSVDGMKEVRGSNPVSSTNAKQGRRWLAVKLRLRLLLKAREPSKIRCRLADFYDAAIDAQMLETTRPTQTIEICGRPSCSPSPTMCTTPAPKASTG
jgi:hypothetical protein